MNKSNDVLKSGTLYSNGDMVRNRDPAERTVLRIMKEILVSCRNIHTNQVRADVTVCLMQLSFLEDHTPKNKTMSPKAEMRSIQIH